MSATTSAPTAAAADGRRLRSFLDEVGFKPEAIRRLLHAEDELLARPRELPVHLRRLEEEPGPVATLVQLFLLGVPVARAAAERDLAPLGLAAFLQAGLLAADGDVTALVKLVPHDELLIASDFAPDERADYVAGVHRPSATLAHLTVREPVARALDVGTGNGIQALLLSAHAEQVVATDVNERALAFAAFNAVLNGVENVEFRAGSFLEPVAGEQFDVVVANPPYVVSPESEYLFRDSGLGRDLVSENLVRALPAVLREGAYATVMVSWIQAGEDDAARPREWLEGSGCDALILHSETDDALSSAASWNRDARDAAEYAERVSRWADYYRAEGIEALGYGAIVLRRRTGDNWVRTLKLPPRRVRPAEAHLRRLFAAQDLLAAAPPLLEQRFAFVADARLEQLLRPEGQAWMGSEAAVVIDEGLGFRAGLDANTTRMVTALGSERPLGELLDEVAAELGVEAGVMRQAGSELVRRLLELGFLVPVG